jgi:hypothetical protein
MLQSKILIIQSGALMDVAKQNPDYSKRSFNGCCEAKS